MTLLQLHMKFRELSYQELCTYKEVPSFVDPANFFWTKNSAYSMFNPFSIAFVRGEEDNVKLKSSFFFSLSLSLSLSLFGTLTKVRFTFEWAVASNSRGPRFSSSHRQKIILNIYYLLY